MPEPEQTLTTTESGPIPPRVVRARVLAREHGFTQGSDERVGRLLRVLAAAAPSAGRILEIGTGVGIGLAWLCDGLGGRTDVRIVSVEHDQHWGGLAATLDWPTYVTLETGDILELFPRLGRYDLIFADAQGGKWTGLDHTIAALSPGGMLVVDDMHVGLDASAEVRENQGWVAERLRDDPRLRSIELDWATGVILAARVR